MGAGWCRVRTGDSDPGPSAPGVDPVISAPPRPGPRGAALIARGAPRRVMSAIPRGRAPESAKRPLAGLRAEKLGF